jgi:TonB family protein
MPLCGAQQQNQQANPKCVTVPVRKIKPELPKDLKGFKSGPSIRYLIEMDGSVSNVSLVKGSGSKAVDEAMLDAVKKSSYRPLKTGCGPVDATMTFTIDFTADNLAHD